MRELKFRVWDEAIHDWHATKALVDFNDRCNKGYNFNIVCFGNPKRTVIEQYTGLKDKNGKEIYEGDVVKYLSYRKDYIGQVVFDFVDDSEGYYIEKHYGWGIYRDGYNTSLGDYADDNMRCDIEVIGNIHENGDLLKGAK